MNMSSCPFLKFLLVCCFPVACAWTVVAILRTNNPEVALRRGIELADLGCTALEVTVDSVGFVDLVTRLREALAGRCLIGAGTVTNHEEVRDWCMTTRFTGVTLSQRRLAGGNVCAVTRAVYTCFYQKRISLFRHAKMPRISVRE